MSSRIPARNILIGHADMLHQLRDAIPPGIVTLQRGAAAGDRRQLQDRPRAVAVRRGAIDLEAWLAEQAPYGTGQPQPHSMIYTSGTTGHPKGVRRVRRRRSRRRHRGDARARSTA